MRWRSSIGCGFDPVLCADTFAEGFDFYHARQNPRTPELAYYLTMNPGRSRLWPELLNNPPPGIFGGFVVGTLEQMQELEAVLRQEMPGKLHTHVLHPPRYRGFFIEISPVGVTKWSADSAAGRAMGDRRVGNLRRRRRRERHSHDSRRRPWRRDGQRPALGQGGRRPRRPNARPGRHGAGGRVADGRARRFVAAGTVAHGARGTEEVVAKASRSRGNFL